MAMILEETTLSFSGGLPTIEGISLVAYQLYKVTWNCAEYYCTSF